MIKVNSNILGMDAFSSKIDWKPPEKLSVVRYIMQRKQRISQKSVTEITLMKEFPKCKNECVTWIRYIDILL